jgi:Flp pilus assembly protein TadG
MMMASTASKQTRQNANERGQALLEMTPVILLMLILGFGVIDFGRAIWQQEVLTGLTREGSDVASRTTPVNLPAAVTAVVNDGAVLNLNGSCSATIPQCGKVIITSVQNTGTAGAPVFVMTGQAFGGNLNATSKIGTYHANPQHGQSNTVTLSADSLPGVTTTIPAPGSTVYVTEIYDLYAPITPIASFMKITMPTTLYDVAYF